MQRINCRYLFASTVVVAAICLAGCDEAKEAWTNVLKKCMRSDLMGKTLYFGPSNGVGPGSIWRPDSKGYYIRWIIDDVTNKPQSSLIQEGEWAQCSGQYSSKLDVKPSAMLETKVQPVSGDLAADLNRAVSITAKVDKWRTEDLKEGPWLQWLRSLPTDNGYRVDARNKNFRVCLRAYKISGFAAQLRFSSDVAAALKAKYSDQVKLGDVGASVSLKWTSDTTLEVGSLEDFYIAGELGSVEVVGGGPFDFTAASKTVDKIDQGRPVRSERMTR
jgi:hypothetical protein